MPSECIISVLTYKRPELLKGCLKSIAKASFPTDIKISVCVIDNDPQGSARDTIETLQQSPFPLEITYINETKTGVVHARNRALSEAFEESEAQWLAFIDDDETVDKNWLNALFQTQKHYQADAVMGDVIFDLPEDAPYPVSHSAYFKRSRPITGSNLKTAYTGNILLSRKFYDNGLRFDLSFNKTGGEDHHFFVQATNIGLKTVYCAQSIAYSPIEKDRLTVSWLMKRAYLSAYAGATSDKKINGWGKAFAKNIIHICGRFAIGCMMFVRSLMQKSYHWSFALRHFYMAKGRFDAFLYPQRFA